MIANTLLMVRPANFGFNEQAGDTNAFQNKIIGLSSRQVQQIALLEFDNYVALLKQNGIEVLVYQDSEEPKKPDAIFPNNWFCTMPKNNNLFLFPMLNPNRANEVRTEIYGDLASKKKLQINQGLLQLENQYLEGTGSLVLDHINKIAYAVKSPRTTEKALIKWCEMVDYQLVEFNARDESERAIYHTNVVMCITDEYVVICLNTIRDKTEKQFVIDTITTKSKKEIIEISIEQMSNFAGNMLQVQNKKEEKFLIMSSTAKASLNQVQIETITTKFNNKIIAPPINLIETIGGGSARCMIAEIF